MFKPENYDGAKAATFGNTDRPPAGPYLMKIFGEQETISRKSQKPMLELLLDIAQGQYTNFFEELGNQIGKPCLLRHYRLLTDEQANYLKGDISSIERSNNGFKYAFADGSLIGKLVGANLQEEEYYNSEGEIKTSLKIAFLFPIGDIAKIKAMPKKCLPKRDVSIPEANSDGLPF
jgi:hypothetical protein